VNDRTAMDTYPVALAYRGAGDLLLWTGPYADYAIHLAGPERPGAFSTAAAVAGPGRPGPIDGAAYVTVLRAEARGAPSG